MRAIVQRVLGASVTVGNEIIGEINGGLLVFLGVAEEDEDKDIVYTADKIMNLRIFEDSDGKMNSSLFEVGGELLIVSQFTLYGDCRKGRRPSFDKAGNPEKAERLYLEFAEYCRQKGATVKTGKFRADMKVSLVNDGPVTLLIDSTKLF